ncbi:unnamed protein product [Lactuca saligna]|uniref:Uncharacterized protein n=1 Tax=Lactuca saligna TaxID=75948 RepID=A0AA35YZX6_LACSI|nr:unnamed protein product [Lactuca saligna]
MKRNPMEGLIVSKWSKLIKIRAFKFRSLFVYRDNRRRNGSINEGNVRCEGERRSDNEGKWDTGAAKSDGEKEARRRAAATPDVLANHEEGDGSGAWPN